MLPQEDSKNRFLECEKSASTTFLKIDQTRSKLAKAKTKTKMTDVAERELSNLEKL